MLPRFLAAGRPSERPGSKNLPVPGLKLSVLPMHQSVSAPQGLRPLFGVKGPRFLSHAPFPQRSQRSRGWFHLQEVVPTGSGSSKQEPPVLCLRLRGTDVPPRAGQEKAGARACPAWELQQGSRAEACPSPVDILSNKSNGARKPSNHS